MLTYVIISKAIQSLMALLHEFIFVEWHPNELSKAIIYYGFATFIGVAIAIIWKSSRFSAVLAKISHKTTDDDVFNGLLDLKNGTAVTATLKNGDIVHGSVFRVEENENDSWISLHNYDVFQPDGLNIHSADYKAESLILIKRADILRVCYMYPSSSEMSNMLAQRKASSTKE